LHAPGAELESKLLAVMAKRKDRREAAVGPALAAAPPAERAPAAAPAGFGPELPVLDERVRGTALEWMLPAEQTPVSGRDPLRFDFRGAALAPDADVPTHAGLHHHGDQADRVRPPSGHGLRRVGPYARRRRDTRCASCCTSAAARWPGSAWLR
jgi:hypothetical protein